MALFDCVAVLLVIVIPAYVTATLDSRFHWTNRRRSLVAALGAVACWSIWFFLSRAFFAEDPFDWIHSSFNPGLSTFLQNLVTLALPVGLAPILAERMSR